MEILGNYAKLYVSLAWECSKDGFNNTPTDKSNLKRNSNE